MDKNKKIYVFTIIEGTSMILLGILTIIEASAALNDVTINKGTEYLLISLVLILTMVATLLGISSYSFLKRQAKKIEPITNVKKTLQPKHIICFLLFNLIMIFRLVTLILT